MNAADYADYADYAETPHLQAHRIASLAVVLLSVIIMAALDQFSRTMIPHLRTLAPLAIIWFPAPLAEYAVRYGGSRFNISRADNIVRNVGWGLLAFLIGSIHFRLFILPLLWETHVTP